MSATVQTFALLIASNVFLAPAWYQPVKRAALCMSGAACFMFRGA